MTRLAAIGVTLLALWLVYPVALGDAKPTPPRLSVTQETRDEIVEQQTPGGATQPDPTLWVTNRTGCVWDPDDITEAYWYGTWEKDQTITFGVCYIGDWQAHLWAIASGEGMRLSLVPSLGPTVSTYGSACLIGPDYDRSYDGFVLVGEGVGVPGAMTFMATNTSGRRLRSLVFIHVRPTSSVQFCPSPPVWTGTYDPRWLEGG